MDQIKDKNVMITGAARGLGYKYAEFILRNGAKCVALIDLSTSPGQKSAETLEQEFGKGKAIFFPCDMTKQDQVKEIFKKVVEKLNGLDILINNAGMLNESKMELTIDLNTTSLIFATLTAMDYMGKHKGGNGGTIVNIASILGLMPLAAIPVYTASKFAVIGFCRSIQEYSKKTGIRFLVMCPGITTTPLVDAAPENAFELITAQKVKEVLATLPLQKTEIVAQAMVDLIQKGENGAVWVSENSQAPYAIKFEHYSKLAVPV